MSIVEKTNAWWEATLDNPEKLSDWLRRLYSNEYDAYDRFQEFAISYCKPESEEWFLFQFIAKQEFRHSEMVWDILCWRGIENGVFKKNDRYWGKVLPCIKDIHTAAGVGALAEQLSLERMRVIIAHPDTPKDLKELFEKIEPDEGVHAKVLAVLAGKHGISDVIDCHSAGLEALGLKLKGN